MCSFLIALCSLRRESSFVVEIDSVFSEDVALREFCVEPQLVKNVGDSILRGDGSVCCTKREDVENSRGKIEPNDTSSNQVADLRTVHRCTAIAGVYKVSKSPLAKSTSFYEKTNGCRS